MSEIIECHEQHKVDLEVVFDLHMSFIVSMYQNMSLGTLNLVSSICLCAFVREKLRVSLFQTYLQAQEHSQD